MFQIPNAAADTLVRTPALLSMVCALMSLSYGCVYIVRFGTMRGMGRASRWAEVSVLVPKCLDAACYFFLSFLNKLGIESHR